MTTTLTAITKGQRVEVEADDELPPQRGVLTAKSVITIGGVSLCEVLLDEGGIIVIPEDELVPERVPDYSCL